MKKMYGAMGTLVSAARMAGLAMPVPVHAAVQDGWETEDGKQYWYEGCVRQGYDPGDASYRGKEIYDPGSDAWYWLDNVQQGAKAVSKDVYPESQADDAGNIGKWVRYNSEGHMVKGWDITEAGTYYFDLVYGIMSKGGRQIDGVDYFFNEATGIMESCSVGMESHWETIDGKQYWYEAGVRQGYERPVNPSMMGMANRRRVFPTMQMEK